MALNLIFEFHDFVIVVEALLTDNSRQEAAEGEPVRRHVVDFVSHYGEQSENSSWAIHCESYRLQHRRDISNLRLVYENR